MGRGSVAVPQMFAAAASCTLVTRQGAAAAGDGRCEGVLSAMLADVKASRFMMTRNPFERNSEDASVLDNNMRRMNNKKKRCCDIIVC